jgi:erythronate-4-phosphate dehydrogenase
MPLERDIHALAPDPEWPDIKIDTVNLSVEQALHEIVKKCYDIRQDDRLLRQLVSVSEIERGKYFQKLRAEYRIRREFFNFTVSLPRRAKDISDAIRLLGFNVRNEE